ncbi:hypothetical protein A5781_12120 [Mycobacterium sp. 852002-30065_SCH5024008]|nr:hypothetical protein A5781_12120 [Mycobacterium sp. 852002-30065_SCH5024008]
MATTDRGNRRDRAALRRGAGGQRRFHRTFAGTVVIGGGIALALLVSCIGALVAGTRRRAGMWKWPALPLVIGVVSLLIAAGLWVN